MFVLNDKSREELGKALFGMANITFAALVVGQFVATVTFRFDILVFGAAFTIILYFAATVLIGGTE